jgi:hypothetical protein
MTFRLIIAVLVSVVLVAGCQREDRSPASSSADSWSLLFSRGGITVYIDTSRVIDSGSVIRAWLRFDYAQEMPKMESTTGPYVRTDAQEDLNCEAKRARDVWLKMIDSSEKVVGDTLWGPGPWIDFDKHPLGIHILEPACDRLRRGGRAA